MSAQSEQDSGYIFAMRTLATKLLDAADEALGRAKEWDNCFGGEGRLADASFAGSDAGLTKTQITSAIAALAALNVWLDSQSQRLPLQTIRFIA